MKHLLPFVTVIFVFLGCGNTNIPGNMMPLDTQNFKDYIFDLDTVFSYNQIKPSVLYFYSPRVLNCTKQTPTAEQIAGVYFDVIQFYSINYEENIKIAEAFKISKLPAFVFVPLNNNIQSISGGVISYHDLEDAFDNIFGINK